MLLESINEKDVAQKTRIDKKSWKFKIILLSIILLLVTSSVLIWGYGFKGFLYLEYKKITKNNYESIVLNRNKEYLHENEFISSETQKKALDLIEEIENYYELPDSYKYVSKFKIETMKSNKKMIYVVTNTTFKDVREDKEEDEKLMPAIFFIYSLDKGHVLEDLLYKNGDLSRIGDYK